MKNSVNYLLNLFLEAMKTEEGRKEIIDGVKTIKPTISDVLKNINGLLYEIKEIVNENKCELNEIVENSLFIFGDEVENILTKLLVSSARIKIEVVKTFMDDGGFTKDESIILANNLLQDLKNNAKKIN